MTTRGIWKIHHAIQTQAAWKDWRALVARAEQEGYITLAEKYQPKEGSSWRVVDRCIAKLKAALRGQGVDIPRESWEQ